MTKIEILESLLKEDNGYLIIQKAEELDISRTYIFSFIKQKNLKKLSKGIYVESKKEEDLLYTLFNRYNDIIYSGETALFLNGLIDNCLNIEVNVPPNYGRGRLIKQNIKVHQEKEDILSIGKTKINTKFGNEVYTYDKERCVLEVIKNRYKFNESEFKDILKKYQNSSNKNDSNLKKYASYLKIKEELIEYFIMLIDKE